MEKLSKSELTKAIRDKALELGFADISFAKADFLEEESKRLKEWLNLGYQGEMSYMTNHFDKRTDPRKLVEGARTVISFMYNYYTESHQNQESPKFSIYARGRDYHKVIKKKLKLLSRWISEECLPFQGRYFVDSAPILERDWANRSGLGWIGKNTLLIHPKKGSYFFLAEMIVDFETEYGQAIDDFCGTCTKCIEACPTDAISEEGYVMDGSKCISYLTIELNEDIPETFKDKMENYVFGCDICQEVCPWNRFATQHSEPEFEASTEFMEMGSKAWDELSEETFDKLFEGSAVKRTGYSGLKRNIDYLK